MAALAAILEGSHTSLKQLPGFVKEADAMTRQASAKPSAPSDHGGTDYIPTDGTERFDDEISAKSVEQAIATPAENPTTLDDASEKGVDA